MPKFKQFRIVPNPGGGANIGTQQQERVIDVPAGYPLPANATAVPDNTPVSDWTDSTLTESEE